MTALVTLLGMVMLMASACGDDEGQELFRPGNTLTILGAGEVKLGDVREKYYVKNNSSDKDYTWSIGAGITLTEDGKNDAFVYLDINALGTYNLEASNGSARGVKSIEVSSREVGFAKDSTGIMEKIENDTITIPVDVTGGLGGDVEIAYSISGSIDPAHYEILPGYESPLRLARKDGEANIKMVLKPEMAKAEEDIIFTLDSVSPALEKEYVITDSGEPMSIKYTIVNDWKSAYIDTLSVELDSADIDEANVLFYPVLLSGPSSSPVKVHYSVKLDSPNQGIADVTPTTMANTLVFDPGKTKATIALSYNISAFSLDQEIMISLDSVVSTDEEVALSGKINKKLVIDTKK